MITIMITIKMKAPQYHHYLHPQSLTDYSETKLELDEYRGERV